MSFAYRLPLALSFAFLASACDKTPGPTPPTESVSDAEPTLSEQELSQSETLDEVSMTETDEASNTTENSSTSLNETSDQSDPSDVALDSCEVCIEAGGTWQPEAEECTQDCDIQDISCYVSECPEPCSPDSCGSCFGEDDCADAGCEWKQQAETMWCTD